MDDTSDKKITRKPPGAAFFMVAMGFYLLLVHGTSMFLAPDIVLPNPPQHYPGTWPWLVDILQALGGGSSRTCALLAIPLMYASMLCVFLLTRQWVPGPVWLGSLAGTFLMAHPAKTEVLFTPMGLYYGLATLCALAALLAYGQLRLLGGPGRYLIVAFLVALATLPFSLNAALVPLILLMEVMQREGGKSNWLRPLPFLLIGLFGIYMHREILFEAWPTFRGSIAPLVVILYPIGFLPETLSNLQANPWLAWAWAGGAIVCLGGIAYAVKSTAFRLALASVLLFRAFGGPLPVNLETLAGGGQLYLPIALSGVAVAGLSAWLMQFKVWGQPTVALTTMICVVLFVLQFQANRAFVPQLGMPGRALETTLLPGQTVHHEKTAAFQGDDKGAP